MKYDFKQIHHCQMCADPVKEHKILGQRMNRSQGLFPSSQNGISVSILQCRQCNLIYSNPQPIPLNIQDHYGMPTESYWKEEYFHWTPAYFKKPIDSAKDLLQFQKGMKALDVGAGLGKAIKSLENAGFEAFGLEPSQTFHEKAISKMGISKEQLKLGSIEELEYDKSAFDFITFGAVLEHLYEPAEALQKAMNWLKPNGIIHFEVPSSNWLIAKLINFYYRLRGTRFVTNLSPMHPPYHLFEFSLDSFEKLGKKLGFEIVKIRYEVCTIPFFPKITHPLLRWYMKKSKKGLQYVVFLKKL